MALVLCMECGKSISDKAASCPGCGCPLQSSDENKILKIDYKNLSKEELWFNAYNMHYKGSKADIPIAIEMYTYLIENFNGSEEANYAKAQLKILETLPATPQTVPSDITPERSTFIDIQNNNINLKKYYKILGLEESASIEEVSSAYKVLSEEWNPIKYEVDDPSMFSIAEGKYNEIDDAYNRINQQLTGIFPRRIFVGDVGVSSRMQSIPTHGGLAAIAFIMGFGVLGGIALGSHFKTKKLIANGDYDAALQASSTTFMSSMLIIIGMPILAVIIIFGMPH